jgi:hypothetical protein
MNPDEFDNIVERASNLAKVSEVIGNAIEGLEHNEKLAVLQNVITREIGSLYDYEHEVIAEMTRMFIGMVMSYQVVNSIPDEEELEAMEEAEGKTRQ